MGAGSHRIVNKPRFGGHLDEWKQDDRAAERVEEAIDTGFLKHCPMCSRVVGQHQDALIVHLVNEHGWKAPKGWQPKALGRGRSRA